VRAVGFSFMIDENDIFSGYFDVLVFDDGI